MSSLGIAYDDLFMRHDTGAGHPERPSRMDAVRAGLEECGTFSWARRIEPQAIDVELVQRIHTPAYLARLSAACAAGRRIIDDPDCTICPESDEIARLAAGTVCKAARLVARGEIKAAFCAVRPPGHHAERDRAMGFCLLNNIALAAEVLRSEFGMKRILIVDWDVHHGNGTQHIFEASPDVFYVSLHAHPDSLYPGTGYEHETGAGAGKGFTLNLPFAPGAGDDEYRQAFAEKVMPAADAFAPQFVLVSAGFDAHADDPLGNLRLQDQSYVFMCRELIALARKHANGRLLSVLEGGYNLDVLRRCVADHVQTLREA